MSGSGAAGGSGTPDEVWEKFLTDSEDAIRASAPREPSARERTPALPARSPATSDAVGELWLPDDPAPEPSWHELDRRARVRRAVRVFATAAAVVLALTVWSRLGTGTGSPAGDPDATTVERVEAPVELPTAAPPSPSAVVPPSPAQVTAGATSVTVG
ncbi:hypothetical protein [Streptomyces sp. CRN 30]|uniref:hypothetical protein n=1 Tax=Streptomyces sp. CRN 30 TaxID=3075613 RepID=UPI002A83F1B8|nr:hypothetical protein [Streptomyces sp. CRN 30]